MKPQLQTRPHPNGDCLRACVAALLDLEVSRVPDWTGPDDSHSQFGTTGYPKWYVEMQQWLGARGFAYIEVDISQREFYPVPFEIPAIFIGLHHSGCRHATVGKIEGDSFFPIFDPLGTNPLESFKDGKILAIGFLAPMDAAAQHRMAVCLDKIFINADQIKPEIIRDSVMATCRDGLNMPDEIIRMPELDRPVQPVPTSRFNGNS